MPPFTLGIELNRAYYDEVVRPLLDEGFADLAYSAALIGYGSDVLGYDTARSTDHEWGPRLVLFLADDDLVTHARALDAALRSRLPTSFRGYPTAFTVSDDEGVRASCAPDPIGPGRCPCHTAGVQSPRDIGARITLSRRTGMARPPQTHDAAGVPGAPRTPPGANWGTWDKRLYPGLQLATIPQQVHGALVQALGEVGVEAEFLLALLAAFPPTSPSPEAGAAFLAQLEAFARRLVAAAGALELATQSYLTALDTGFPELHAAGGQVTDEAEPWWPDFAGYALPGEPLELRLRRCGFSYRHVISVHLSATVEAIAEQMALVLHALSSLPPAGVLPVRALAQGLYELADAVQGDVVPHRIRDLSPEFPGLLTAIERLRALGASEDTSLASDIVWAREQYAQAQGSHRPAQRGLLTRLFARAPAAPAPTTAAGAEQWAAHAAEEWRTLLGALEAMQTGRR